MLRHPQAAVTREQRRESLATDAHVPDQEDTDHRCDTWTSFAAHSVSRSNVMVPTAFTSRLLPRRSAEYLQPEARVVNRPIATEYLDPSRLAAAHPTPRVSCERRTFGERSPSAQLAAQSPTDIQPQGMWIKDAEYADSKPKARLEQAHQIDGVQKRRYACRSAS